MFSLIAGLLLQLAAPKVLNVPFPANEYRDTTKNYIVIHYDSSMEEKVTLNWLRRKHNSYHYFILRSGTILKLVDPKFIAGHAGLSYWDGNWHMNRYSIGICLQNKPPEAFTTEQYQSTAWLINRLANRFPDVPDHKIVGHSDVAWPRGRKKDPGDQFQWDTLNVYVQLMRQSNDSSRSDGAATRTVSISKKSGGRRNTAHKPTSKKSRHVN